MCLFLCSYFYFLSVMFIFHHVYILNLQNPVAYPHICLLPCRLTSAICLNLVKENVYSSKYILIVGHVNAIVGIAASILEMTFFFK